MPYVRKQVEYIKERIEEPRKFIQVLAGCRQIGKSTMVDQLLERVTMPYTIDNADGADVNSTVWVHNLWESARVKMKVNNQTEHLLVIDEIQKINNWSEYVKREWDQDTHNGLNLKVILLGSSRLMLKHGLTESLMGRFEMIKIGHWTYNEMREAFGFTLDEYIYFGGFPGSAHLIKDERRWRRYICDAIVAPSVEKDVIMTSFIYKPALMKQLFELGCGYSAELLSLTKVVAQLQDAGNVTTLANYLQTLNEAHLLCGLQKYAMDNARKYNSIPKFQVYNNAFLTAFKGKNYKADRTDPSLWGRWVESAVGVYLLSDPDTEYKIYYWRDGAEEVDFVLVRDGESIAIEVKSGRKMNNRGMSLFSKSFNPKHSFFVGESGLTLEELFSVNPNQLFN